MNKIIYIAELDQDVDDYIAAIYLKQKEVLAGIVCDPAPVEKDGIERLNNLKELGIRFYEKIPEDTKYVVVGGALTIVADYLSHNTLDYLFIQGGFVGKNIIDSKISLPKFKNKTFVRTFNFNVDVKSTEQVLKSSSVKQISLIGKNVCHSNKNTSNGIWSNTELKLLFDEYHINPCKRMHDLLACHEAICILVKKGIIDSKEKPYLHYKNLFPYTEDGLNGIYTKWGSSIKKTEYNQCVSAVGWKYIDIKNK